MPLYISIHTDYLDIHADNPAAPYLFHAENPKEAIRMTAEKEDLTTSEVKDETAIFSVDVMVKTLRKHGYKVSIKDIHGKEVA